MRVTIGGALVLVDAQIQRSALPRLVFLSNFIVEVF
jgi:hypothetical protein